MTLTAIATLALGIGASTALFTVVNTVLLRPLNYPNSEAIVELTKFFPGFGNRAAVTPTKFDFWRKENHSFQAVAALNYGPSGVNLTGRGEPERLTALPVTADFFRVLGVRPLIGQSFNEAEDKPGSGHFVILSYAIWKRLFNGNPKAIGQTLTLSGANYVVVGVMPESFDFPDHAEVWTPLQLKIDPRDRANNFKVIARLKDGVPLAQAQAEMRVIAQLLRKRFGDFADESAGNCRCRPLSRLDCWRRSTRALDPDGGSRVCVIAGLCQRGKPAPGPFCWAAARTGGAHCIGC